ncbi:MAG: ribonuclease III [candidate division FCPU426 bacterium]
MVKSSQPEQALNRLHKRLKTRAATLELLREACRHRSYVNEHKNGHGGGKAEAANERLEFFGDAVLGFIIAKWLFQKWPQADEGRLSQAKSRLVSAERLAHIARRLELGQALLLGQGEEVSGGRERASLLANILEAVIGAVALGEGTDHAEALVRELWAEALEEEISGGAQADYKSLLQEYSQKTSGALPEYTVEQVIGPDHNRRYLVAVSLKGRIRGRGEGPSKKQAAQAAAAQALTTLKHER